MPSRFSHVCCLACGYQMPPDPLLIFCKACGDTWLDARYDYDAVDAVQWTTDIRTRPATLWRYEELLPLTDPDARITIGEGWTPIVQARRLGDALGHDHLLIKDERRNPTNSFKDRQGAVAVSVMKQNGIRECVLASTGNAAASYAAYCARAGIKLWIFLTSMVPAEKMRELGLYGAEVVKVTGTYDQAKKVAADFAERRELYLDRGARGVPGKESMKTLAYEIAEQLGLQFDAGKRWIVPDWYVQAVSGGIGPLGAMKGFQELYRLGLTDKVPKLGIVQSAGCAPMVQAFERGDRQAAAVVPETLITVLATGDPGRSYVLLRDMIVEHGGTMISVDDGQAFRAMRRVARTEGLSVEPAAAVAFAGIEKMLALGHIGSGETVLINCSGHTFPAEKHILEEQYVLDLELGATAPAQQVEGLGAALERLDEQIKTIVVIDDNPHDSRLIRRLLQAQKNYRIFETNNPLDGLDLVIQRKPDLVITDLMMPQMDGFALLDQLKSNSETAHIPVIVLSAKALTTADRGKLEGRTEVVWTKGSYKTRDLVDYVATTLGDMPVEHPAVPAARGAVTNGGDTHRRVLIVDDNPHDSRLVRRILEATHRFEVMEAHSGSSALKMISEHLPDMVILDMILPDMGGLDVLEIIRSTTQFSTVRVAILSAKDLSETERQRLHDAVYWQKATLDRRRLIEAIEEHLR